MFFLLPYITANLPEQFRGKWTFLPYMSGMNGQNFVFSMIEYGAAIDTDHVFVSVKADEENKTVDLQFYAKEWESLEENDYLRAFYNMMDISIGEVLTHTYINEVARASSRTDDMLTLTNLEKWILDNLCEDGKPLDPAQRVFVYKREPTPKQQARYDIFIGTLSHAPLIDDYYNGEDIAYKTFVDCGAKPMFLYYYYSAKVDTNEVLNQRYDLMEKLEAEVLGERGTGREIGLLLGGAMGKECAYIDMVLYDEQAFIEKTRTLLADTPVMFFCKEFVYNGREYLLFDSNDPLYNERLRHLKECEDAVNSGL